MKIFRKKKSDIFHISAQNIDCGYSLEPPLNKYKRISNVCYTVHRILQSTLVISNSKGLSEIHRDIRTATYQICRTEEKLIRLTTFNKCICNLTPEVRVIENIVEKRRNCS